MTKPSPEEIAAANADMGYVPPQQTAMPPLSDQQRANIEAKIEEASPGNAPMRNPTGNEHQISTFTPREIESQVAAHAARLEARSRSAAEIEAMNEKGIKPFARELPQGTTRPDGVKRVDSGEIQR